MKIEELKTVVPTITICMNYFLDTALSQQLNKDITQEGKKKSLDFSIVLILLLSCN